ncbi:hypothetical protein Ciccas_003259, partial [Cichlidogyrus casuarinus]
LTIHVALLPFSGCEELQFSYVSKLENSHLPTGLLQFECSATVEFTPSEPHLYRLKIANPSLTSELSSKPYDVYFTRDRREIKAIYHRAVETPEDVVHLNLQKTLIDSFSDSIFIESNASSKKVASHSKKKTSMGTCDRFLSTDDGVVTSRLSNCEKKDDQEVNLSELVSQFLVSSIPTYNETIYRECKSYLSEASLDCYQTIFVKTSANNFTVLRAIQTFSHISRIVTHGVQPRLTIPDNYVRGDLLLKNAPERQQRSSQKLSSLLKNMQNNKTDSTNHDSLHILVSLLPLAPEEELLDLISQNFDSNSFEHDTNLRDAFGSTRLSEPLLLVHLNHLNKLNLRDGKMQSLEKWVSSVLTNADLIESKFETPHLIVGELVKFLQKQEASEKLEILTWQAIGRILHKSCILDQHESCRTNLENIRPQIKARMNSKSLLQFMHSSSKLFELSETELLVQEYTKSISPSPELQALPFSLKLAENMRKMSCGSTVREEYLRKLFFDTDLPSQLRITGYLGLMECANDDLLEQIYRQYTREVAPNVRVFIKSHVSSLKGTNEPIGISLANRWSAFENMEPLTYQETLRYSIFREFRLIENTKHSLIARVTLLWSDTNYMPYSMKVDLIAFRPRSKNSKLLASATIRLRNGQDLIEYLFRQVGRMGQKRDMLQFAMEFLGFAGKLKFDLELDFDGRFQLFSSEDLERWGDLTSVLQDFSNSLAKGLSIVDWKKRSLLFQQRHEVPTIFGALASIESQFIQDLSLKLDATIDLQEIFVPKENQTAKIGISWQLAPKIDLFIKRRMNVLGESASWFTNFKSDLTTQVSSNVTLGKAVRLEIHMPNKRQTLLHIENESSVITKDQCTGDFLAKMLGVRLCVNDLLMQLGSNGVTSIFIEKVDSHKGYIFELSGPINDRDDAIGRIFKFQFDTPESTINRRFSFEAVATSFGKFLIEAVTPTSSKKAILDYHNMPRKLILNVESNGKDLILLLLDQKVLLHHNRSSYDGSLTLKSSITGQNLHQEIKFELSNQYGLEYLQQAEGQLTFYEFVSLKPQKFKQVDYKMTRSDREQVSAFGLARKFDLKMSEITDERHNKITGMIQIEANKLISYLTLEQNGKSLRPFKITWKQKLAVPSMSPTLSELSWQNNFRVTPPNNGACIDLSANLKAELAHWSYLKLTYDTNINMTRSGEETVFYADVVKGNHLLAFDDRTAGLINVKIENYFHWESNKLDWRLKGDLGYGPQNFALKIDLRSDDRLIMLIDTASVNLGRYHIEFISRTKIISPFVLPVPGFQKVRRLDFETKIQEKGLGYYTSSSSIRGDHIMHSNFRPEEAPSIGTDLELVNLNCTFQVTSMLWYQTAFTSVLALPIRDYDAQPDTVHLAPWLTLQRGYFRSAFIEDQD